MSKDYYAKLGVSKSASQDEIKKAFRELAHKHHPDKPGGDASKFKEINEAYQVLGDASKRQQYDQFGSAAFDGSAGGSGFQGNPFDFSQGFGNAQGFSFDMGDLGDIFGDFFGGGRSRKQKRGGDIEVDLKLTFKEAAFGAKKKIELYKNTICVHCSGEGGEPGSAITNCANCGGTGQVTQTQRTILGHIQTRALCSVCQGDGKTYEKKCKDCHGEGRVKKSETIEVEVPGGIEQGMTMTLRGKGEAGGRGASAGDLHVRVLVSKEDGLEREGADVFSDAIIPFTLAALGGKFKVETLDGPETVGISEGTQSGEVIRLRGKGAIRLQKSGRGDHLITLIVDVPRKLSRSQRRLLERFRDESL